MAFATGISVGVTVVVSDKTTVAFTGTSVILTDFDSGATETGIYSGAYVQTWSP